MRAEIITVGTEIMVGSILNTNSKYISSKLVELGIETCYHTSVDDNDERLTNVINIALDRADVIITTGGLGPTQDDLTKEVISKALGLKLIKDLDVESNLVKMFSKMNRPMTDNNRKQAVKPENSDFIKNDNGTAPGIFIYKDNKKIVMLPGPPKELIPMFENSVVDLIKDDNYSIIINSINTIGIGESSLEVELKSLDIYDKDLEIATFAKAGSCEVKLIGRGSNKKELENKINNAIIKIEEKLGAYIYGYDNEPIAEVLVKNLVNKNYTIAICESCTGGLISSMITNVAGASNVFDRGLVTYSNNSKVSELGVNTLTLTKYGAVSEETAYEMAKGLLEKAKTDIVLSITGIAGPDGGSENKPVGLVYICVMSKKEYEVKKHMFSGNRSTIQERASIRALAEINKFLQ